jgi:hypothetical protein
MPFDSTSVHNVAMSDVSATYGRLLNRYFITDGVKYVTCVQITLLWVGPWKILLIASSLVAIANGMWDCEVHLGVEVSESKQ